MSDDKMETLCRCGHPAHRHNGGKMRGRCVMNITENRRAAYEIKCPCRRFAEAAAIEERITVYAKEGLK